MRILISARAVRLKKIYCLGKLARGADAKPARPYFESSIMASSRGKPAYAAIMLALTLVIMAAIVGLLILMLYLCRRTRRKILISTQVHQVPAVVHYPLPHS